MYSSSFKAASIRHFANVKMLRPLTKRESEKIKCQEEFQRWYTEIMPNLLDTNSFSKFIGNRPFPFNLEFIPYPYLSKDQKCRIFKEIDEGKTDFQVSQSFGISLKRIEALRTLRNLKNSKRDVLFNQFE